MKIGITGTPGTGKSSVAENLSDFLDWKVIKINEILTKNDIYEGYDEKRGSYIVDQDRLDEVLEAFMTENCIVEGHLAHYVSDLDYIFVLRAKPKELKKRLKSKGWNKDKIVENVQAEILDTILQKSTERHSNVCEINTTKKSAFKVAKIIQKVVEGEEEPENFKPGQVDWTGYLSY